MDFLQTPVTDTIRPFSDSPIVVKRRWYPVPWGTPTMEFPTSFTSHHYMHSPWAATGIGEVYPPELSYERRGTPAGMTFDHFCGTEYEFQNGALFDPAVNVLYDDEWIPLCCGRDSVCTTQLCAQAQVNDRPAAQLYSYPVPHQEAAPGTPFQLFQVALNQGNQDPAWPGILTAFFPSGLLGDSGWSQYVLADDSGQMQSVEETTRFAANSAITQRQEQNNYTITVEHGGASGSFTLAMVAGVLVLSGVNATIDFGLGTAAFEDVGTTGHTLPFLDGVNTWTASNHFRNANLDNPSIAAISTSSAANDQEEPIMIIATHAGTTTVNHGVRLPMYAKVGNVVNQYFHSVTVVLTDATFATWKTRAHYLIGGSTPMEYMQAERLGAGPGIGFLGAAAIGPQAGDVGAALVAFGLMTGVPSFSGNAATATTAGSASVLTPGRTINGVAFDGSLNIEVRLPAANTAGQTVCAAFTITAASGVYQATGNTFPLPAAGTYLVTGRVHGQLQVNANGYSTLSALLFNVTDAAAVANSETVLCGVWLNGQFSAGCGAVSFIVTVAAAKTLELYAARHGANWVVSGVASDATGRTVLDWVRLY